MAPINPVPVFNFTVVLTDATPPGAAPAGLGALAIGVAKGVLTGSFSEVSGLNAEFETEEYREGGRNTAPLKFVKWGKYPNLVFKRGVTFSTDLWDWYHQVLYGSDAPLRKNGIIMLTDRGGGPAGLGLPVIDRAPVAVWMFRNGLPEKLQGPGLNAKSNEIAVESLEIAHEGLVRVGPSLVPGAGDLLASVSVGG